MYAVFDYRLLGKNIGKIVLGVGIFSLTSTLRKSGLVMLTQAL